MGIIDNFVNEIKDLKIICFTEHWLYPGEATCYNFTNYNCISMFCRDKLIHGGVGIYIHNSVKAIEISSIKNLTQELHCELTCVLITKFNLVIVVVYRSNSNDSDFNIFINIITDALHLIDRLFNNKNIIVCGDFNVQFLDQDNRTKKLTNLFGQFNLKQAIFEHTRVTKFSKTCPDNIFTNLDYKNARVFRASFPIMI